MDIICEHCNFSFNRDSKFLNQNVEEYRNIFGSICPNCGKKIEPLIQPLFIKEIKRKEEELRLEVLKKIKEKYFKDI